MSHRRGARLAEALALAAVAGAGAFLATRSLGNAANTDEGVYLASLRELRHGARLGADIFVSQPPGFYWLLRGLAAPFGATLHDLRLALLLLGLVAVVSAWALGRALGGAVAGIAAAAVLVVAPPIPVEALRVEADLASVALALAALAVLAMAPRRPWLAACGGVLLAAAILVKLLVLPVLAPAAMLVWRRFTRRSAAAAGAGLAAAAIAAVAACAGELGPVWHGSVGFHVALHEDVASWASGNARTVLRYLTQKSPFTLVVVPLGALATIAAWRLRRPLGTGWLWTWPVASAVFLGVQRPLLDHHFVLLAAALAVPAAASIALAAARLPPRAAVTLAAVLALAVAAGYVQEERRVVHSQAPDAPGLEWAVDVLRRRTPPGSTVVSDVQIVPYRAGRRTVPDLVDTSAARFEVDLTGAQVLAEIRRSHAAAVVFGRAFRSQPGLEQQVARLYPTRLARGEFTVYLLD